VTVRQLGVMEECTMCLQRIEREGRGARGGRKVRDGDVQTACQQTCPTQAITFGNLKEGGTRVSQAFRESPEHHVLHESGRGPA